jgi:hypothetical protein
MVSLAQTKKLMSPFLKRHPDFVAIDRRFYRIPITHVAPCILIDRSGDKNAYRVYLQLYPLVCVRRKGLFSPFHIMYRMDGRTQHPARDDGHRRNPDVVEPEKSLEFV